MNRNKKIAIVGAGPSGLAAAWMLHRDGFDITVYEAGREVGGDYRATTLALPDRDLKVEVGGLVTMDSFFPNVYELCRVFDVATTPVAGNYVITGADGATWGNAMHDTPFFQSVKDECNRFTLELTHMVGNYTWEVGLQTMGQYCQGNGYSERFARQALTPMLSFFTDMPRPEELLNTSMAYYTAAVAFKAASFFVPMDFRRFTHTSADFFGRIAREFAGRIRLKTPVQSITRLDKGVRVADGHGAAEVYDEVVIAVKGDSALKLLGDPSPEERNLLGLIGRQYGSRTATLHSDPRVVSPHLSKRPSFEVCDDILTFNFNHWYDVPESRSPIFLSIDAADRIDPKKVFRQNTYSYENLSVDSVLAKSHMHRLQGRRHTWFCGSCASFIVLEDVIDSGFAIASALGAAYPFADNVRSNKAFTTIKAFLLQGRTEIEWMAK